MGSKRALLLSKSSTDIAKFMTVPTTTLERTWSKAPRIYLEDSQHSALTQIFLLQKLSSLNTRDSNHIEIPQVPPRTNDSTGYTKPSSRICCSLGCNQPPLSRLGSGLLPQASRSPCADTFSGCFLFSNRLLSHDSLGLRNTIQSAYWNSPHYAVHHLQRMMQDQAKLESEGSQNTGFLQRPVCNVVKMKPQRTFSSFPNSG